ncbi:MAG: helix-turn-helix transcriptional regulator [Bacteroidetes bacterium]|nr:helix-turn-helix transcriptional regulator [Bacteroidota bacterium]
MDYNKIVPIANILPVLNIVNYIGSCDPMSWGPRINDDFELILIRKGVFSYESGINETLDCLPGMILIIPPGEEHTLYSPETEWAFSCIHCLPHGGYPWSTGLISLDPKPRSIIDFSDNFTYMDELFYRCNTLFNSYDAYSTELAVTCCREIWLRCAAKSPGNSLQVSERMQHMLAYIREHIADRMNRQVLAEIFHLSPEYVNTLFKQELGISTSACIHREKVIHGYQLLHSQGLSVAETAYACGFSDPFYFSRVFKKVLGIAPDRLRGRTYFT